MGVSFTASGGSAKFDIFDNGLALLALHSACLGLAFTAAEKEGISSTFNIVLMIAGFSCGAVLSVLAAYYGVLNSQALGPVLTGATPAASPKSKRIPKAEAAPTGVEPPWATQTGTVRAGWRPTEGQAHWLVIGAVFLALACVGTAVDRSTTAGAVAAVEARRDSQISAAVRSTDPSVRLAARIRAFENVPVEADRPVEIEAEEAKRAWRGHLVFVLAVLVLAPIPFAWRGPHRALKSARGLLVLGSLLSFVLAIGGALVPLAAQAVETGLERAAAPVTPPGAPGTPGGAPLPPAAVVVHVPGQTPVQPGDPALVENLNAMEQRLGDRIDAIANRPLPQANPAPPVGRDGRDGRDGAQGEQGPKGAQGERGTDGLPGQDGRDGDDGAAGAEGDMWRCRFALSNPPSFRVCEAVRPDGSVRAPARGEPEQDQP